MQPAFISHYPDQNPRFHCGPPSRQRVALGRTKVRTSLHTHLSCASICFQRFLFFFFLSWQLGLSRHRHNCQRQLLVKDRRRVIFFISRSLSLATFLPVVVIPHLRFLPHCAIVFIQSVFKVLSRSFPALLGLAEKPRQVSWTYEDLFYQGFNEEKEKECNVRSSAMLSILIRSQRFGMPARLSDRFPFFVFSAQRFSRSARSVSRL